MGIQVLFTPIAYADFKSVCGGRLGAGALPAYLLSGGSPVALGHLATAGTLPEFVIELVRDWIYGECAASARSRASMVAVLNCLCRSGGSPISQAKLARDAGLANNTVAAGYLELLGDLLCVAPVTAWDASRQRALFRKPAKAAFVNLLCAVGWHAARLRSVSAFENLPEKEKAILVEWLVGQELWRRWVVSGKEPSDALSFWASRDHEVDYVAGAHTFVEVKLGKTSPLEFAWFPRTFPKARLFVINAERYEAGPITGLTLEDFLLRPDIGSQAEPL